jgi:hypothetical protein|tara:strand:- start:83 stop:619 length:537 start_codon:yes stop_codon:yes gene_type:complete
MAIEKIINPIDEEITIGSPGFPSDRIGGGNMQQPTIKPYLGKPTPVPGSGVVVKQESIPQGISYSSSRDKNLEAVFNNNPTLQKQFGTVDEYINQFGGKQFKAAPKTQDALFEGFAAWKEANPDKLNKVGTMALVPTILPGGFEYTFNDGASASNFSQYLEDSGYEPYKTNYKTTKIT